MVGLDEIVDGEVVLAVVQASAAADDLFELDHGIDGAHEHDIADVARIDPGGEFLRSGQDGGDGFLVVLEIAEILLTQVAIVGGDALAVVGIGHGLHLVDEVADGERVVLRGAEDQRFFIRRDLIEEQLDAVRFARLDFDDAVEVGFGVTLAGFDFAFDQLVVGGVDVLVEGGGDLLDLERGEEAVVDAVLERINEDGLAEVGVGIDVVLALGGGGEAELDGGLEVVEDAASR
ncbi:MAG TPA: hypothetical protein VKT49_03175 [Bryobacteraceae bacterium]|nr:hypothetical protein [Bryobacteraceae bacterium]